MSGGDAFWRSFTLRACRYAEVVDEEQRRKEAKLQFFQDNWKDLMTCAAMWMECISCNVPCKRAHVTHSNSLKCSYCGSLVNCDRDFCKKPIECPKCANIYFF